VCVCMYIYVYNSKPYFRKQDQGVGFVTHKRCVFDQVVITLII